MSMRTLAVASMLLSCAGPERRGSLEGPPQVESDAKSIVVDGLRITRPDGWTFESADPSLGDDARVMILGPLGAGGRTSIVFYLERLTAAQKRLAPGAILHLRTQSLAQTMEGVEPHAKPTEREIGGYPGASVPIQLANLGLDDVADRTVPGRVYNVITKDALWTLFARVPEGSGGMSEVEAVIGDLEF